jgi:hypothetical protein
MTKVAKTLKMPESTRERQFTMTQGMKPLDSK